VDDLPGDLELVLEALDRSLVGRDLGLDDLDGDLLADLRVEGPVDIPPPPSSSTIWYRAAKSFPVVSSSRGAAIVRVGGAEMSEGEGSDVAHSLQNLESEEFSARQRGHMVPMIFSLVPCGIYITISGPGKGPEVRIFPLLNNEIGKYILCFHLIPAAKRVKW
jgi:hypothetical protein